MRKKIVNITAITLAAGTILVTGVTPVYSGVVANEVSVAGLSTNLDLYLDNVASGITKATPVTEIVKAADTSADTQATVTTDTSTDKKDTTTEKKKSTENSLYDADGHIKLNLNYDRLGIAKVDTYLNIRKKPSEDAKVVGKLIKNSGCHIYYINKKGWAKIVSGKVTGFVKASYLITDKKAEAKAAKVGSLVATVNTPALMVRLLPSTDAKMTAVVALEEDFDIRKDKVTKSFVEKYIKKAKVSKRQIKKVDYDKMMENLDDWVCIKIDNDLAFVAKEYVDVSYKLRRAVKIGDLQVDEKSGVSSGRVSLVEYAKQFLGNPYVWGGTSLTNGADCSGFVQSVFAHYGISLPRVSGSQAAASKSISGSEAKPGDLFFYGSGGVSHVAIYIGSGMIIHASNPSTGIKISNAYYRQPCKIGRVLN